MRENTPPYSITNEMVDLVSKISEKLGKISNYREFETKPYLRKNNRIRSIHSSLAIEANSLSLDEVRGVVDGKVVIGPQREIQEVKNAYQAYEQIDKINPYSIDELKRIHGVMTYLTVEESGVFRRGEEGVFAGERCIFMAPPAKFVNDLMVDLFQWMREEQGNVHPLILSSIFHYELVFIHPFADGNGRMARLWQTCILAKWNPVFQYLPLESRIYAFQEEYYTAISRCHTEGSSNTFILFMLEKIDETLSLALQQAGTSAAQITEYVRRLLEVMEYDTPYTAHRIMELLHLKSKETLRKHYIHPALKMGYICMGIPDKPTSRNQTYIKK